MVVRTVQEHKYIRQDDNYIGDGFVRREVSGNVKTIRFSLRCLQLS